MVVHAWRNQYEAIFSGLNGETIELSVKETKAPGILTSDISWLYNRPTGGANPHFVRSFFLSPRLNAFCRGLILLMMKEDQNIIIYKTQDGRASVSLYEKDGSVWKNQQQLAERIILMNYVPYS